MIVLTKCSCQSRQHRSPFELDTPDASDNLGEHVNDGICSVS